MIDRPAIVVTSIFQPGEALKSISKGAIQQDWRLIIVGDNKSPKDFYLQGSDYFDLESQEKLELTLAKLCPQGHYTRKNIGYLVAMKQGSRIIIETDDDNIPVADFWMERQKVRKALTISGNGWHNIYSEFTDAHIWPRGFPLEHIHLKGNTSINATLIESDCPIQQGLADGNPDVDAVYRMTHQLPINFRQLAHPVKLRRGVWSPFNSQNTTWFKDAFPLMYLPSYCSFRMTDIWRSFVAQRIAWECGWEILFHHATVYQERNDHNLLKDFDQEIPGYLNNHRMVELLENLSLKPGIKNIAGNLVICYEMLAEKKIIYDPRELDLLSAWLNDI